MMSLRTLACTVAVVALAACSASPDATSASHDTPAGGEATGGTGAVSLELIIGSGSALSSVSYTLTGPSSQAGTINVANSEVVSALLSGITAGSSYVLSMSGRTNDGAFTCAGQSAPFNVAPKQTTSVTVELACSGNAADAGALSLVATSVACPVIEQVTVLPASASVAAGGTMSLLGAAQGLNPGALTYRWTASSGSIENGTSIDATFACTTVGPATVTFSVSDGSDAAGCGATQSVTVTCTP